MSNTMQVLRDSVYLQCINVTMYIQKYFSENARNAVLGVEKTNTPRTRVVAKRFKQGVSHLTTIRGPMGVSHPKLTIQLHVILKLDMYFNLAIINLPLLY
jgi:hypothetical protein